MLQQNVSRV